MNQVEPPQNTRSKVTLVILVAIFIAPIVLAYITYKYRDLIPTTTVNFGEVLDPAKPLPEFQLRTLADEVFTLKDIRRKWSYVYITNNICNDDCQLNLVKMKNARLAQGGEAKRIRYYLVFNHRPEQQIVDELAQAHPKMTILYGSGAELQTFLDAFKVKDDNNVLDYQRVYMVDPIGNYIMYYNNGFEAIGIMEDLKLLLKISQIG